jgi:diacylglycerol O-acyltransferase
VRVAGSVLTTVVRTLATLGEPVTALRAPTGPDKVVGWTTPRPLAPVQQASRARAVSVNDLLLAAASGGLRAHLLATGSPVGDLRVLVPVDLRGGRPVGPDLGNRFGVVFVPLPVGEAARDRRVELVQRATRTLRGSAQAGATYVVLTVVGLLPSPLQQLAVNLLGASASAVVTNVPGPRGAIEVAGHRVQDVVFWVPQVGRVGLGISLFSYAGTLSVGVALDAGSGLDPQALAVAIDDELTALTAAAPDA